LLRPRARNASPRLAVVSIVALGLGGCEYVSTTATEFAGIGAGALAGGLTGNPFVAVGVGAGVRYAVRSTVAYGERALQGRVQETIAEAAGPLEEGEVAAWAVTGFPPVKQPRGRVEVVRAFGEAIPCKEITYGVENGDGADYYVAVICRERGEWVWAVSEPSTDKWFGIQ
jgi:hypothetical protein